MSARDDPDYDEQKNYEQKKRNPRRLFSFDSLKSSSSSRHSSEHEVTKANSRSPLNPFELSNVQEGDSDTTFLAGDRPEQVTLVEGPIFDVFSSPADRSRSSTKLEPIRPISTHSSSSTDNTPSAPSTTTTRARWENLRQHVLPGLVRPLSPQPSAFNPPSRSLTPKPSGLARLGFRHVVEQAQEVVDDTRKFRKEILKACVAARYAEVSRSPKDRDGQGSTTSLAGTIISTSTSGAGRKMDYFPQSIASLTSSMVSTSSGSTITPSLKLLYQVLIYHSRPHAETDKRILVYLPLEGHVLGALLCPFLTPSKYPVVQAEEEKAIAVEAFELILKIWTPIDEVSICPNIMKNNVD